MERTFAQALGDIAHLSPLKRRAARLGLSSPDALVALAVRRGCRHYAPYAESRGAVAPEVSEADFSNEELITALLLGSWPHTPVMIRAAAQLMAGKGIRPPLLARLAVQERCVAAMRYIAEAGRQTEPSEDFWKTLLGLLPPCSPPPAGAMPHPSRFRRETGMVSPFRPDTPKISWLRPSAAL